MSRLFFKEFAGVLADRVGLRSFSSSRGDRLRRVFAIDSTLGNSPVTQCRYNRRKNPTPLSIAGRGMVLYDRLVLSWDKPPFSEYYSAQTF